MPRMSGDLSYQPDENSFLEGKMLIAMPTMGDERFARTLIYMCVHNPEGAMGIVVNKPAPNITMPQLLNQLEIHVPHETPDLHQRVMDCPVLADDIGLTASVDILRAIAGGRGPDRALLALGYAGWAPGQLEAEIQANGWLHCDPDKELLFGKNIGAKYHCALAKLGVNISLLSGEAGHA